MRRGHVAILAAAFAAAGISAAVGLRDRPDSDAPGPTNTESASPARRASASDSYSNIFAADYVGPEACASCHPDKHATWSGSLHRAMNQIADATTVVATTGTPVIEYGGVSVDFVAAGEVYAMTLRRGGRLVRRYRITRTIGSASLQEYVGVQIEGPEPAGDPIYETEVRLPFGYWIDRRAWFHQQYFDSWFGPEHAGDGAPAFDPANAGDGPWNRRCPWCHNTYPFAVRAVRAHADDPRGFGPEQYVRLAHEIEAGWRRAAVEDNELPIDQLVTVGISCESCHFGGRAHALDGEPMLFWPRSPALQDAVDEPPSGGRESSGVINAICAQCHSAPSPVFPDGSAVRNSREALDMLAGSCASAIACTDCHDPHVRGSGRVEPDRVCAQCHPSLADAAAAGAHSRHGPGVGCADCHMPRIVQGITDVVRTHRISSPGSGGVIGPSAPNACNLCHIDRSTRWTVDQLSAGWQLGIAAEATAEPAGDAWLRADSRDTRLIAIDALARSGRGALPALIEALDHPVAYDRMRAVIAVETVLGRRLQPHELDPSATPARRRQQIRGLRETLSP